MMGRRRAAVQQDLWVPADRLARTAGHPFYEALNRLLAEAGFDAYVQQRCAPFYCLDNGRPGVPPEVYVRMLLVGFFEGIDSERGIAWRCADSLALRQFLGYPLDTPTPDHSSLSRIRKRLPLEVHGDIFTWALAFLAGRGLLSGKTVGVDATTLEANAAMRSIVQRGTGDSYHEFLTKLAQASGIETPTRDDLARMDRKRKKTLSNKDWGHAHDADARIAKMKDGRTRMAHKAEHAVDMDSGAVLAVTLQGADQGDTTTIGHTLCEAIENLDAVTAALDAQVGEADDDDRSAGNPPPARTRQGIQEVVADKGYHSNDTCRDLKEAELRTYISEPDRGGRKWDGKAEEQQAVYGNRRRIKGQRGKALMRLRGELIERGFAHCYETGGLRRIHLRGHPNILKRLLIHVVGFNLSLFLRRMLGVGKPRCLQDGLGARLSAFMGHIGRIREGFAGWVAFRSPLMAPAAQSSCFSFNRLAA